MRFVGHESLHVLFVFLDLTKSVFAAKHTFIHDSRVLKQAIYHTKVQVGNDQEKVQSERNSHSKNRGGGQNQINS